MEMKFLYIISASMEKLGPIGSEKWVGATIAFSG